MSRRRNRATWSLFAFQDIITSVTGVVIFVTLMLVLDVVRRAERAPGTQTDHLIEELTEAIATAQSEVDAIASILVEDSEIAELAASLSAIQLSRQNEEVRKQVLHLQEEIRQLSARKGRVEQELDSWVARLSGRSNDRERLDEIREEIATIHGDLERLKQSQRVIYNPSGIPGKESWLVDLGSNELLVARAGRAEQPASFADASTPARIQSFFDWARKLSPANHHFVLLVRPATIEMFHEVEGHLSDEGFSIGFDLIGAEEVLIDPETGAGI